MKSWIKNIIQQSEFGYLSTYHNRKIEIFPFVYQYDKGCLKLPISILFPDLIEKLTSYPYVVVLIIHRQEQVRLFCQSKIEKNQLDQIWETYRPLLRKYFPEFDSNGIREKPALKKHVLLDLIPFRIEGESENSEKVTYEMEIL